MANGIDLWNQSEWDNDLFECPRCRAVVEYSTKTLDSKGTCCAECYGDPVNLNHHHDT